MKLKYIAISLLALTLFASCNRDEESLFEKSAAQRAVEAIDNANAVLTAPENGWEMVYFPNTETRGYNLLVQFYDDSHVKFTAKNSLTTNNQIKTDSASTWTLISDYGPLLSFDTYNEVFHIWSDPQTDGDGYLGDYEFLILKATAEQVKLKGKKHSGYSFLNRLPAGLTQEEYYEQKEAMDAKLFSNGNVLELHQGNAVYSLFDGADGIFQLAAQGQLPDSDDPEIYPVSATCSGIQLMKGFKDNKDNTVFTLKNGRLVFGDDEYLCAGNLAAYVTNYMHLLSGEWNISTSNTNEKTAAAAAAVLEELQALSSKAKKNASVQGLTLSYNVTDTSTTYQVALHYTKDRKNSVLSVSYVFDVEKDGEQLTLSYGRPADKNATVILNKVPAIVPLMETLNGTYSVQTISDPINPTLGSKLVSTTNPDVWFEMEGKL